MTTAGSPSDRRWILLGLRTDEPESVRLATWHCLEELAHKLPVPPPPPHRVSAWFARGAGDEAEAEAEADADADANAGAKSGAAEAAGDAVLRAFESSLLRGKLAEAPRSSFLYRLVLHHLAAAAFARGAAADHLLVRLVRGLADVGAAAEVCADLCRATRASLCGAALSEAEAEAAVTAVAQRVRRVRVLIKDEVPRAAALLAPALAALDAQLRAVVEADEAGRARRHATERQTGRAMRHPAADEGVAAAPVNRVMLGKLSSALETVAAGQEEGADGEEEPPVIRPGQLKRSSGE